MNDKDVALITGAIKKYYLDYPANITAPYRILDREFGYQRINNDSMIRHLSYSNERELRVLLVSTAPSDVYCSNAFYLFPKLSMKQKSWGGANLIFDIDSKDLKLSCRPGHSIAICQECMHVSAFTIGKCAECSSTRLIIRSLPCTKCIDAAFKETKKLQEILINDLGIENNLMNVYFSGNEGFHVHVEQSEFEQLNSRERGELVDYIMLRGAIPETYGIPRNNTEKKNLPTLNEPGWRGRLVKILGASATKQAASKGYASFQNTLTQGKIGPRIDPQVTSDIHRIFRMPGSINGKSGLVKLPINENLPFNPYKDACLIDSNKVTVNAQCPRKFRLGTKSYGPYSKEDVTVELYAAVYMICKGLATVL